MAAKGLAAGMQVMAASYAVNAKRFLAAMKAADPRAVTGVPWVFGSDGSPSPVAGGNEWNNTVLKTDGKYVSFVDAHWYPFGFSGSTGGSNPTDQQVLRSLFQVPSLTWQIRNELTRYDPAASFIVGEAGVSYNETMTTCTPAGALFAAGDVLSWLAGGARERRLVGHEQLRQHRLPVRQPGRRAVHLGRQAGPGDPLLGVPARRDAGPAARAARHAGHLRPGRRAGLPVGAGRPASMSSR